MDWFNYVQYIDNTVYVCIPNKNLTSINENCIITVNNTFLIFIVFNLNFSVIIKSVIQKFTTMISLLLAFFLVIDLTKL